MARKDFMKRNGGFTCLKCGVENAPGEKRERNHCFSCLWSLHVDYETPGDRQSDCRSLMEPAGLAYRGNKGFMILHRCGKCRKEMWNRAAEDDEMEKTHVLQNLPHSR